MPAVDINADALAAIRQRSRMTPGQLAEAVNISRPHLVNLEAGKRQASDDLIIRLADALRVPVPAIITNPNAAAPDADDPAEPAGAPA